MSENKEQRILLEESNITTWTKVWHSCRRILVSREITDDSVQKTASELVKISFISDEPITLMIQSGGGSAIPILQLGDVINSLNCPVDAVVIGDCGSMAVDLVQMCRRRIMLPSSRMLIHYIRHGQRWVCDDPEWVAKDIAYFQERITEIAEKRILLYEKRTGLRRETISEIFRHGEMHGAYFSAQQCIKMNLADEIITDFKIFPKEDTMNIG